MKKEKQIIMQTLKRLEEIINPLSYEERIEYGVFAFKKKYGEWDYNMYQEEADEFINEVFIDKLITVRFVPLGGQAVGKAIKTENVIEIDIDKLKYNKFYYKNKMYGTSGYKKENKFMVKNVQTYESKIKWVITHEYTHLVYPYLEHTNEFFSKIEQLYQQL